MKRAKCTFQQNNNAQYRISTEYMKRFMRKWNSSFMFLRKLSFKLVRITKSENAPLTQRKILLR
jgi:hypothetical protein